MKTPVKKAAAAKEEAPAKATKKKPVKKATASKDEKKSSASRHRQKAGREKEIKIDAAAPDHKYSSVYYENAYLQISKSRCAFLTRKF